MTHQMSWKELETILSHLKTLPSFVLCTLYLAGRLGLVTVVFKFSALCNDTQALEMDSADTNR